VQEGEDDRAGDRDDLDNAGDPARVIGRGRGAHTHVVAPRAVKGVANRSEIAVRLGCVSRGDGPPCQSCVVLSRDSDALAHSPLARQVEALEGILRTNPVASGLLERAAATALPSWYLGAGGVAQSVWNHLHGFAPTHGIVDYDIVYFDPDDLTEAGEKAIERELTAAADLRGAKLDASNQARVHLWYERRFGRPIAPYRSAEHAIATWPTTATSIGVRAEGNDFVVSAPFGLADLFALTIRPNATLVHRAIYEGKAARWRRLWPRLTVLPWP
jgi:hypothetical protein